MVYKQEQMSYQNKINLSSGTVIMFGKIQMLTRYLNAVVIEPSGERRYKSPTRET
jgi:hypothetical protein